MSDVMGIFCQYFGKSFLSLRGGSPAFPFQSFPSLRGNVNEVDEGEFKNNKTSTPPPLWGTSPQSREGLLQPFQSSPSSRGNVNAVDKGELRNIKINNKIEISTPPPLWGTSPQSREGFFQSIQPSHSLRGRCPQDRGGANNKLK